MQPLLKKKQKNCSFFGKGQRKRTHFTQTSPKRGAIYNQMGEGSAMRSLKRNSLFFFKIDLHLTRKLLTVLVHQILDTLYGIE